jgi:hypothetical protein
MKTNFCDIFVDAVGSTLNETAKVLHNKKGESLSPSHKHAQNVINKIKRMEKSLSALTRVVLHHPDGRILVESSDEEEEEEGSNDEPKAKRRKVAAAEDYNEDDAKRMVEQWLESDSFTQYLSNRMSKEVESRDLETWNNKCAEMIQFVTNELGDILDEDQLEKPSTFTSELDEIDYYILEKIKQQKKEEALWARHKRVVEVFTEERGPEIQKLNEKYQKEIGELVEREKKWKTAKDVTSNALILLEDRKQNLKSQLQQEEAEAQHLQQLEIARQNDLRKKQNKINEEAEAAIQLIQQNAKQAQEALTSPTVLTSPTSILREKPALLIAAASPSFGLRNMTLESSVGRTSPAYDWKLGVSPMYRGLKPGVTTTSTSSVYERKTRQSHAVAFPKSGGGDGVPQQVTTTGYLFPSSQQVVGNVFGGFTQLHEEELNQAATPKKSISAEITTSARQQFPAFNPQKEEEMVMTASAPAISDVTTSEKHLMSLATSFLAIKKLGKNDKAKLHQSLQSIGLDYVEPDKSDPNSFYECLNAEVRYQGGVVKMKSDILDFIHMNKTMLEVFYPCCNI